MDRITDRLNLKPVRQPVYLDLVVRSLTLQSCLGAKCFKVRTPLGKLLYDCP